MFGFILNRIPVKNHRLLYEHIASDPQKNLVFVGLALVLVLLVFGIVFLKPSSPKIPNNNSLQPTSVEVQKETRDSVSPFINELTVKEKEERTWKKEANNHYVNEKMGISLTLTNDWHMDPAPIPDWSPNIVYFFNEPTNEMRELTDQGVMLGVQVNGECSDHYLKYYFSTPSIDYKNSFCANLPKIKNLTIDGKKAVLLGNSTERTEDGVLLSQIDGPAFGSDYLIINGDDVIHVTFFSKKERDFEQEFASIISSIKFN